jgi:hypothetical protein
MIHNGIKLCSPCLLRVLSQLAISSYTAFVISNELNFNYLATDSAVSNKT